MTPTLPAGYDHGTARAYRYCRPSCDDCRAANTADKRERAAARRVQPIPQAAHGKPATYTELGCRCRKCKRGYTEWKKSRPKPSPRARPDITTIPAEEHGTLRGYQHWACKCGSCKAAGKADRDEKKAVKRGPVPEGPVAFRRYKYRIHLTPQVEESMDRVFRASRSVYNAYVAHCRAEHEAGRPHPSEYDATRLLVTQARREEDDNFLGEVAHSVLSAAVANAAAGYQAFFDSIAGKRKGPKMQPPRFKSWRDEQSARFPDGGFNVRGGWENTQRGGGRLYLAKVGHVRVDWHRPLPSYPTSVTITRGRDGTWFASFVVQVPLRSPAVPTTHGRVAGIDLGLGDFVVAVYSDGSREKVAAPKFYRAAERKLARAHEWLSRTEPYSKNHEKARLEVARVNKRAANLRSDFILQLVARLVRENHTICVEDLDIQGMIDDPTSHRERRKSIYDATWGGFLRELKAQGELTGREILVAPRYFPGTQTCAVCGHRGGKLPLDVRVWTCTCGAALDRDYNAATNHLKLARGSAESLNACGVTVAQLAGVDETNQEPLRVR